jgi:hypothetical protein
VQSHHRPTALFFSAVVKLLALAVFLSGAYVADFVYRHTKSVSVAQRTVLASVAAAGFVIT